MKQTILESLKRPGRNPSLTHFRRLFSLTETGVRESVVSFQKLVKAHDPEIGRKYSIECECPIYESGLHMLLPIYQENCS